MRSDIPCIVNPVARRVTDKVQLFTQIKAAAVQAVDHVQSLRETLSSEQTQQILRKSQESMQKDNDMRRATEVPQWGWSELYKVELDS